VGLLIPPGDIEALSNGLDNMLDLCEKFKPEQISNYATEHFSIRRVGEKLNEIYLECIKKC
jgi:glycosyltransferase involved in cell wall biosynthesis